MSDDQNYDEQGAGGYELPPDPTEQRIDALEHRVLDQQLGGFFQAYALAGEDADAFVQGAVEQAQQLGAPEIAASPAFWHLLAAANGYQSVDAQAQAGSGQESAYDEALQRAFGQQGGRSVLPFG